MAKVATYLNFPGNTEEAFTFYKQVFKADFAMPIMRFGDIPPQPGQPPMGEAEKKMVMHVNLPITGGHNLMGTDAPESMGFKVVKGNNVQISLGPDTRAEADRLFKALSEGGKVEMPMADQFWGAYFGSLVDKFGIHWMINCEAKA